MKILAAIFVIAVLLLACAACTSQPSTPTITIDDDRCTYSGPDSIQADQFTFEWVMNGKQYEDYSISAIQVEEGHSVDDLVGLAELPSWISRLRYEIDKPGMETKEMTWDLTTNARFQPKPVYFLCAGRIKDKVTILGVTSPVEVED
jgi:hypothetical protein